MIGIFGGTFDPVHFGHLRPALEVFETLGLREMRFVPSGQPPHRSAPVANAKQRETLLRAALGKDTPGLVVDVCEIKRDGPSYMVDTLEQLGREVNGETLCLVLGIDAFLQLESWDRWEQILERAHLVVTHRPGWSFDADAISPALAGLWQQRRVESAEELEATAAGRIISLPVTQLDISATQVRECISAGDSPRFLVPDAVWNLIRLQSLYGVQSDEMPEALVKHKELSQ